MHIVVTLEFPCMTVPLAFPLTYFRCRLCLNKQAIRLHLCRGLTLQLVIDLCINFKGNNVSRGTTFNSLFDPTVVETGTSQIMRKSNGCRIHARL